MPLTPMRPSSFIAVGQFHINLDNVAVIELEPRPNEPGKFVQARVHDVAGKIHYIKTQPEIEALAELLMPFDGK